MPDNKIAERYARALLSLSRDQGHEDAVRDDLAGLATAIEDSHELKAFLRHPTLTRQQQDDCIDALFASRLHPLTFTFIKFLAERRRLARLGDIALAFGALYLEAHNVLRISVSSAQALTDEQANKIRTKMAARYGKTIELSTQVDEALIAGFTIRVLDTIHDSSVKGKLDALRRTMCHA